MNGTCSAHADVHPFRNDPDPCIGWHSDDDPLMDILDMLDELEIRVDNPSRAYPQDEYLKSGIREAKNRVFIAMRTIHSEAV